MPFFSNRWRDKENLSLKLKRAKIVFSQKINIPKLDDDYNDADHENDNNDD